MGRNLCVTDSLVANIVLQPEQDAFFGKLLIRLAPVSLALVLGL